jgi:hypothetical protein
LLGTKPCSNFACKEATITLGAKEKLFIVIQQMFHVRHFGSLIAASSSSGFVSMRACAFPGIDATAAVRDGGGGWVKPEAAARREREARGLTQPVSNTTSAAPAAYFLIASATAFGCEGHLPRQIRLRFCRTANGQRQEPVPHEIRPADFLEQFEWGGGRVLITWPIAGTPIEGMD